MTGAFPLFRSCRLVPSPLRAAGAGLGAMLVLAGPLPASAGGVAAPPDSADGAPFAARLEKALLAGPIAWDRLWSPHARDAGRRLLDARSHALFDWTDVKVHSEDVQDLGDGDVATDVVVRGTARWRPKAWGVASAFWTQQTDERFEANHVVRRERWIRDPNGRGMIRRELLSPFAIEAADIQVGVYPGEKALLVEGTYHVRALVDGVRYVRFLLDRRSQIYDLRVNGKLADFVRGNELGSLGLEGFSPELESSLELPSALGKGEEAVVHFKLRSPLVHMEGKGFVTSLPIRDGPFRERVWLPVFGPAGGRLDRSDVHLVVNWPQDTYRTVAIAAPGDARVDKGHGEAKLEEERAEVSFSGNVADLDFALLAPDATLQDLPDGTGIRDVSGKGVLRFTCSPEAALLRGRAALVRPLMEASQASQDLSNELDEMMPVDQDFIDELFDESSENAERGADDRQAG